MLLALSVLKQQKGITGLGKARGKRDCKAVWPVSLVWEWPKFWPTGCYIPNIASGVPGTVPYPLGNSFTREAVSMGLNPQCSFLLHKRHRISLEQLKLIPRLSVFAVYANRFWLIDFLPRAFFVIIVGLFSVSWTCWACPLLDFALVVPALVERAFHPDNSLAFLHHFV